MTDSTHDRDQASLAVAEALNASSWHAYIPLRDAAIAQLRRYGETLRQAARSAGDRSHHRQSPFTIDTVRLVTRRQTVTDMEETELWADPAGETVYGWPAVATALAAICIRHGTTVDPVWLAGRMQWRRSTVIREGEATCRVRLPTVEELWLVAIVGTGEETKS